MRVFPISKDVDPEPSLVVYAFEELHGRTVVGMLSFGIVDYLCE
jgi:hypothetical protein